MSAADSMPRGTAVRNPTTLVGLAASGPERPVSTLSSGDLLRQLAVGARGPRPCACLADPDLLAIVRARGQHVGEQATREDHAEEQREDVRQAHAGEEGGGRGHRVGPPVGPSSGYSVGLA
jgi:hypothetical protein